MTFCLSCGEDRNNPPRADEAGHCLKPSDHHTPEPHQVWVWLAGHWQIRGTGVHSQRDNIAAVLAVHRWKNMSTRSVQCECGAVIFTALGAELTQFPADDAFRLHLADKILEAL